MAKLLSLCLLLASTAALSLFSAAPPPKGAQDRGKEVVTLEYDVKDLVGGHVVWRGGVGETDVKVESIDDLIRLLVKQIKEMYPKDRRGDLDSILESNGTTLEIRTTKVNHGWIADSLASLRRFADVEIVVEAGLYAVDRAYYENELAPRFAKQRWRTLGLDENDQEKLRKASRLVKTSKSRLRDGDRGQIFSLRRAIAYDWQPRYTASRTAKVAFVGVRLEMEARASSDRRFVRMHLTQHGAERIGMRKELTCDDKLDEVTLNVPDVQQSSTTNSLRVGDGGTFYLAPTVPIPGFTAKGPVPLLFVHTSLWIREEEEARKQQGVKD